MVQKELIPNDECDKPVSLSPILAQNGRSKYRPSHNADQKITHKKTMIYQKDEHGRQCTCCMSYQTWDNFSPKISKIDTIWSKHYPRCKSCEATRTQSRTTSYQRTYYQYNRENIIDRPSKCEIDRSKPKSPEYWEE